jgi:5-methylcytosine-specific restriction endonuclease McrA
MVVLNISIVLNQCTTNNIMATEKLKLKWREYNKTRKQYRKEYNRRRVFKKLACSVNCVYKDNKITAFDLFKIAKHQKLRCALTGMKLTNNNISVDHIIPKSKGGLNISSNIRLVLLPINIARMDMTDEEFVNLCKGVVNYAGGGTTPPTV